MNETPPNAWFYTREGQRVGPVTFEELRMKTQEGGLDPRLDMVWSPGMPEWKPSGEIDGLFEKRSGSESEEALAASADPYRPPTQDAAVAQIPQDGKWPGARRRSYLFMTILFPLLFSEGFAYGPPFLAPHLSPEMNGYVTKGLAFVPLILGIHFSLQRFVNLGMSRWWFFGNFVPILNFWVGYRCFACPSGYAQLKKMDGVGVFLAIIYWLLVVIGFLALIVCLALIFGAVSDPALRGQIQEYLRAVGDQARKQ